MCMRALRNQFGCDDFSATRHCQYKLLTASWKEELEERQLRVRPANGTIEKKGALQLTLPKKDSLASKRKLKTSIDLLNPDALR